MYAPGALVLAALCWGSVVVTVKIASRGLTTLGLTVIELTATAALLGGAVLVRRRRLPRPTAGLLAAAALEPGVAYVLINAGFARTSGAHAALLVGLESAFVVLLSAVLTRTLPRPAMLAGLALAVGGAAALADGADGNATLEGDLLVLLGVLASAGYVVLAHRAAQRFDALELTGYQFLVGWLLVVPVAVAVLSRGGVGAVGRLEPQYVVAAVVTGVLGSAVAFGLYNWALGSVSAATAGISLTLIPVFGVALSVVFLGEQVTVLTLLAGAAVLAGLVITQWAEQAQPGGWSSWWAKPWGSSAKAAAMSVERSAAGSASHCS